MPELVQLILRSRPRGKLRHHGEVLQARRTHERLLAADHPRDAEKRRAIPDADGLVKRFFSPLERDTYAALPDAARPDAFYRGWVCKEAVIKAAGATITPAQAINTRWIIWLQKNRPGGQVKDYWLPAWGPIDALRPFRYYRPLTIAPFLA